jgi:hypothetical protein
VVLVVLSLAILGCQREAGPPELLGFDPPSPSVQAGESMYVRLTYDAKDTILGNFSWTVEAGTIVGDGLSTVIQDFIENPFVLPIVHGRQHTTGTLIELIDSRITRKRLKRSLQKRAFQVLRSLHKLSTPCQ